MKVKINLVSLIEINYLLFQQFAHPMTNKSVVAAGEL